MSCDASYRPLSAKDVLEEIKSYENCIHHVPHGSEDLMAAFTTSLLEKAANSGLLSDMRALYLAPRVVLAHLRRGGKKHEAQVRAQLRERIAQWPALPPPTEPAPKPRKIVKRDRHPTVRLIQKPSSRWSKPSATKPSGRHACC